jgi:RNA polymerase sigma-70 factor, ECF subfamily
VETTARAGEIELIRALRDREEAAFAELARTYHSSMLRVAQIYVSSRAVAEEVIQETWIGVLRGIDRFEGRSSLKTWIFRILTNTAKTRAAREGRTIPFSALDPGRVPERAVDAEHPRSAQALWMHSAAGEPPSATPHPVCNARGARDD